MAMREYPKIETLYERDMNGSKTLIEGRFRNSAVEYLKNNCWEWTEKIDGTNIRVHWDGHRVEFAGRTDRSSIPAHLMNKLVELFASDETEELFEQKFGEKEVTFYGEGYGVKIQNGGNYRPDVSFILFDVLIGEMWLGRASVEEIATAFGIEVVPIISRGEIDEAVDFVKSHPKSTIGSADMEGLVGRPMCEMLDRMGNRIIVKVKCCDFKMGK